MLNHFAQWRLYRPLQWPLTASSTCRCLIWARRWGYQQSRSRTRTSQDKRRTQICQQWHAPRFRKNRCCACRSFCKDNLYAKDTFEAIICDISKLCLPDIWCEDHWDHLVPEAHQWILCDSLYTPLQRNEK